MAGATAVAGGQGTEAGEPLGHRSRQGPLCPTPCLLAAGKIPKLPLLISMRISWPESKLISCQLGAAIPSCFWITLHKACLALNLHCFCHVVRA